MLTPRDFRRLSDCDNEDQSVLNFQKAAFPTWLLQKKMKKIILKNREISQMNPPRDVLLGLIFNIVFYLSCWHDHDVLKICPKTVTSDLNIWSYIQKKKAITWRIIGKTLFVATSPYENRKQAWVCDFNVCDFMAWPFTEMIMLTVYKDWLLTATHSCFSEIPPSQRSGQNAKVFRSWHTLRGRILILICWSS